ncbi:acyltransferase [Erythrobacter alti]|uniref:acyltransferase family protein n=1 Tax=Erythrobacter alti TaxID=1896145 RepID=UPI0030F384F6
MVKVGEIRELTFLRAIAAWWVVTYHFKAFLPTLDSTRIWVIDSGSLGVDIFFVLSGFVLAYVYATKVLDRTFNYREFLINRIARVYPLHLATMFALLLPLTLFHALGLQISGTQQLDGRGSYDPVLTIFTHLFAVHAWGFDPITYFNGPSWSISAEWFAYLLFPVFGVAFLRTGLMASTVMASALLIAVSSVAFGWLGVSPAALPSGYGIWRILPEFAIGLVAYRYWREAKSSWGWVLIGLGFATLILDPTKFTVPLGAAGVVVGFAMVRFDSRVLHFLGKISYSTYMIHALVIFALLPVISRFPTYQIGVLASAIVVTLIGSIASYYWVEVPARNLLRNIVRARAISSPA